MGTHRRKRTRFDGEDAGWRRSISSIVLNQQHVVGGPGSPGPEVARAERAHQGRAPEEEIVGEMLSRRTMRLY
jgi:hypothetical protein